MSLSLLNLGFIRSITTKRFKIKRRLKMYAKIKSRREKNEKHEQRQSDSNGWMKKNRRCIVASAVMGVAVIVFLIFSSPRVDGNLMIQ